MNENLNEETALLWGEEAYNNATNKQGNGSVELAAAIYSKEWGCPEGGELGVSISGTAESKEEVEENVRFIEALRKTRHGGSD